MDLSITTPAAQLPITVAEFKSHARVEDSAEDLLIEQYIAHARYVFESFTRRALINTVYKLHLQLWPEPGLKFPRFPVTAISSITYIDPDGAQQTLDLSRYQTNFSVRPNLLVIDPNYDWPSIKEEKLFPIEINFTAGLGADSTSIPDDIKTVLFFMVSMMYEDREGRELSLDSEFIRNLLRPYKVYA